MVKTLKHMQDYMDDVLKKNYVTFLKDRKNENPLIKTYIFENHTIKDSTNKTNQVLETLNFLKNDKKESFKIKESEDVDMVILENNNAQYFFDISNTRFWKMHSLDYAKNTDKLQNILLKQMNMDSIWLPSSFMYSTKDKVGDLYSLGISFKDILEEESTSNIERFLNESNDLNLQLSKKMADPIISSLLNENFQKELAFNSIGLLTNDDDDFIVDTIKYHGKFTARGNSFSMHIHNVNNVLDDYINKIVQLEKELPLKYVENKLYGNYAYIKLSKQVDIFKFIDLLCDGKKPFRLFGTPIASGNIITINAIDTHVGNFAKKLNININTKTNELMVELLENSCGNSIARLITNINLFVDASATVMVGDNKHDYFRY
ncbi:hypothetical protein GTN31_10200 [Macrococcoides canis]|uniref:hypothetical protein n=1 Tax=Macrococcoides canis TaxID=1855823 RepID=UPI0013E8F73B|nr:hypothetical protein [Macrococcus canis]QIH76699.1 hypothetical protein GTN31_10200 [Macrococcus canis]